MQLMPPTVALDQQGVRAGLWVKLKMVKSNYVNLWHVGWYVHPLAHLHSWHVSLHGANEQSCHVFFLS